MLSKNKLSRPDEDKNTPKDKNKDKDKTTYKTMIKIEDKDKTIPKTKTKTKDKTADKTTPKTKTKTKDKDENRLIKIFHYVKPERTRKNDDWVKRQIVMLFWNDKHISNLCEKWIYRNREYAYTRFEELRTYSGEVLFTGEHKATTSKRKKNIFINIDKLKVFKKFIHI